MSLMKLMVMRHGQSQGNAEGRMEGWQSTGLTAQGRTQALNLGQRLAQESWHPTQIYCSPLERATETLDAILAGFHPETPSNRSASTSPLDSVGTPVPLADSIHVSICIKDTLKEYHNGVFAGLTWAEAQERYPDLCQALEQSLDWLPIPEAETLAEGRQRAQGFIDELLSNHGNGDQIWVISHQWILQQIIACLMGCDRTWGIPISHTGIFEFWLDHSRWIKTDENRFNSELWQIKRFNDCEHCNR